MSSESDLTTACYTQPEVLEVTRLRPAILQTWINRGVIKLVDQNPGYGRRRLYSKIDVVKLAIMRRLADFQIGLPVSKDLAERAAAELSENGSMEWDIHVPLRGRDATHEPSITVISSGRWGDAIVGDASLMPVAHLTEVGIPSSRRSRWTGDGSHPIDHRARERLAAHGIHAEPALIVPIGEIVNGTLIQLDVLDDAKREDRGSAQER